MSDRIEEKIDVLLEKVHTIDKTLVSQHESLVHHIKRTDMLEEKMYGMEAEAAPIKKAYSFILISAKVVTFVAALVGAVLGALKLLGKI